MLRMLETSDVRRETEVRRPAARVVNRSGLWLSDDPLVPAVLTVTHTDRQLMVLPDSAPVHVPPEVERQLVPLLQLDGLQQGDEDWEDGVDAGSLGSRDSGDLDLLVELILQVQSKPVEIGVSSHVIANLRVAAVGGVGEIGIFKLEQFLRSSHGEAVLGTEELKPRNI